MTVSLVQSFGASVRRFQDRVAVIHPGHGEFTYGDLFDRAARIQSCLTSAGVTRGDCVPVVAAKSIDTVAALYGVMMAGAAYVPVDPASPAPRAASIAEDCDAPCVLTDQPDRSSLGSVNRPVFSFAEVTQESSTAAVEVAESDLAYVLFTSGSTGRPKGVPLTHGNARAFLDWCSTAFEPLPTDRFSSHAPFTFDLSILDVHLPLRHGAAIVLIDEMSAADPRALAGLVEEQRLTVWYSVPSILSMMAEHGRLDEHDASTLRLVLFAGEVFPIPALRRLQDAWPRPVYWNLYGPTETNVCTAFQCPDGVDDARTDPYPIGPACAHCTPLLLDENEQPRTGPGRGRLLIAGPSVMSGYLNRPELSSDVFSEFDGVPFYDTGDIVEVDADGCMTFRGRADRMIKRRGYRIEPGEVEAALMTHESIESVAVYPVERVTGITLEAAVVGGAAELLSIITLKQFCAQCLPKYMIPDRFRVLAELPLTSNGKIDYARLIRAAETA